MHESAFSYNLARPYPYRWFTWVVVLGGIAATALFSVISVAANGFDQSTLHVTNPNGTEHPKQPKWYQKPPWSLASKILPKCEDQTFSIGSKISTNNLLYSYEIMAVNRMHLNETEPVASFAYHNDIFRNCWVTEFVLQINSGSTWEAHSSVYISCTIFDNDMPTTVFLKTIYDDTVFSGVDFDSRTQPSLWWAQFLIYCPWDTDLRFNGSLTLSYPARPLQKTSETRQVVVAIDGFDNNVVLHMQCEFLGLDSWSSTFGLEVWKFCQLNPSPDGLFGVPLNVSSPNLPTGIYMDAKAKLIYSSILTDLGQTSASNMLADPRKVWGYLNATEVYLSSTLDVLRRIFFNYDQDHVWEYFRNQDPDSFYAAANLSLPHVNSSIISTEYLCQIPKQKPIGSLIYSVIVADLVFLQVLWTVFTWAVKFVLERQDLTANQCSGCMKLAKKGDDIELVSPVLATKHGNAPQYRPPPSQERASVVRRRPVPLPSTSALQEPDETTVQLLEPNESRNE